MSTKEDLFVQISNPHYTEAVPLLALNTYKPDSHGEDFFSRKQAWFYVYGDEEIHEEFRNKMSGMMQRRFVNDEQDWDMIAPVPSHVKGDINQNISELAKDLSNDTGIDYQEIVSRKESIRESHELDAFEAKAVNLEGSLSIDSEIKGKNIILIDNISLSGATMLHTANSLLDRGAENVFGITLGLSDDLDDTEKITNGRKASDLLKEGG